jgi:thiamine pyrophosphate-dependent acetolactate synthase large subunit-like protein
MKGYEAVQSVLRNEGVSDLFTLMSEDNMKLVAELDADDEFNVVDTRHEQTAVTMAYSYAKSADTVGVATVGRGPAVAQTGNALVTARKLNAKVVVIVPKTEQSASYSHRDLDSKEFDQDTFLDCTIGEVVGVTDSEELVERTIEAFRMVRTGAGPVALQIPRDILNSDLDSSPSNDKLLSENKRSFRANAPQIEPEASKIDEAINVLLESDINKAPVIIAGLGIKSQAAEEAVIELAERLNALLVTTLQAQGLFTDHPYHVGFCGDYGHDLANKYTIESDYILGIGCSLNPHTADSGHLFDDGDSIVHVDANPQSIERFTDVDVGIVGDAKLSAEAFVRALESHDIDLRGEYWTDSVRREISNSTAFGGESHETVPDRIDPRDLAVAADDILPEDRTVVLDGGHFTRWVLDAVDVPSPGNFVWTVDFASIGQGVPAGVGAAVGGTSEACIAFCGDAGFMMSLQELETAVRHDVPVTYIVFNDEALGAELHNMKSTGYEGADTAAIPSPDFAEVANSLGAKGTTVRSVSELRSLENEIVSDSGPLVVDCKVIPDISHPNQFG